MEIKEWGYAEFPEFTDIPQGVETIGTTGDELGISYVHDVEYANVDGIPLHVQILIPSSRNQPFDPRADAQPKALPCFVYVQGSAWMEQYVYADLCQLAKLAARGYVCAVVQYRHSGQAVFPAQAVDARNAVRFLRVNAQRYGIDPQRVIMAGSSSGGHTAMWAGLRHNDDTPENLFPGVSAEVSGIVNYYGSVSVMLEDGNPSTLNHHLPDSPEGMEMGGVNLRERPDLCRQLSVEENIHADTQVAPTLIFHGTKDRIVNTKESVLLYNAMKAAGKEVSLYLLKGADHGGPEFWADPIVGLVDRFARGCFG